MPMPMPTPMKKIDYQLHVLIVFLVPVVAAQNAPPPPQQFGFNGFNPSMAIIIVVLVAAFFFMGFFSIYVRRRSAHGSSATTIGRARSVRSRRGANRGLEQAVIETFPTFAYSEVKNLKLGKGTLECAVCLCEFEDEETLRLLPKCSHVFHPDCIDMWLHSHVTCPVCRCNLSVPPAVNADAAANEAAVDDIEAGGDDSDYSSHHETPEILPVQLGESNHESEEQETAVLAANVITPAPNRPPRSGSIRRPKYWAGRFPRSHSTGHSLVQPGENCERYTLRLPEHVRKQILKRTSSCLVTPSEGSVRRGHRIAGESISRGRTLGRSESGVGKSDRWVLSMVPSFISRSFSVKSASLKRYGSGDVEQGTKFPSVNSCLGGAKADEEETAAAPPQRSATPVFTVATINSPR